MAVVVVLVMGWAAQGCTCATPEMPDALPSPDVMDPLEPCALGIRRAAMDLPSGGERVAMLGDGERLWVADAVGLTRATARLTELALDGTRLSLTEAALPDEMVNPQPGLVLAGSPPTAIFASSVDRRAFVSFGEPPRATELRFLESIVASGGDGSVIVFADDASLGRVEPDGGRSMSSPIGEMPLSMSLTPADATGRGAGVFWRGDNELSALAYDFSTAPPTIRVSMLGVRDTMPGLRTAPKIARREGGWLVMADTYDSSAEETTIHALWLDEALEVTARHTRHVAPGARSLGAVSGPHGDIIVFEAGSLGVEDVELRVAVADAPGEVRGGERALAVVGADCCTFGEHVWSAIPGSVSLAVEQDGLVEVLTFCAPL